MQKDICLFDVINHAVDLVVQLLKSSDIALGTDMQIVECKIKCNRTMFCNAPANILTNANDVLIEKMEI
jgi:hypothetical protein